jgi:hypothetical protein
MYNPGRHISSQLVRPEKIFAERDSEGLSDTAERSNREKKRRRQGKGNDNGQGD